MADKKISQLTGASTPVAGTEVLPIVQSGATVKVSIDNLTKGRVVNALSFDTDVAAAAVTLSGTTLAADGTDANIDINVTPKGTGKVVASTAGTFEGVYVGRGAASVTTNTAVGTSALGANQAGGTNNTAVGYQALDANTTGDENTAVGQDALGALSTGTGNTGLGYGAGSALTTGSKNVVVGKYSGNQGSIDIRTSNNNVMLSDGDGNLVHCFSSANDTLIAPQVNIRLRRYVKTVSLDANTTTDLITFTQSTYLMNVIGTFEILFIDGSYPNGCVSQLSNAAYTTTTGDSVVRGNYSEINVVEGEVGSISLTIAAATSKSSGVLDGIFKITGQTNANTSGTCVIIFNGIIDGCTIS